MLFMCPREALCVATGSFHGGCWVVSEEDGECRDAVYGATQCGDLGQALSTEVVVQSQAQCVEGLVVVQDSFTFADVGCYPARFGAHWPAPFLTGHLGGSLVLTEACSCVPLRR